MVFSSCAFGILVVWTGVMPSVVKWDYLNVGGVKWFTGKFPHRFLRNNKITLSTLYLVLIWCHMLVGSDREKNHPTCFWRFCYFENQRGARLQRRKEFHAVSITRALKVGEVFSSPWIQVGANEVHFQHRKPKRQYACLEWVFNF